MQLRELVEEFFPRPWFDVSRSKLRALSFCQDACDLEPVAEGGIPNRSWHVWPVLSCEAISNVAFRTRTPGQCMMHYITEASA